MHTDQSAELVSKAMRSFNFAEDLYPHPPPHRRPFVPTSCTELDHYFGNRFTCLWVGGSLTAICLDYMYTEWTGCRNALIFTTNAFWHPHPSRQFVSISSLFFRKCILLMKLFVFREISGRKCRTARLVYWPAGMKEEWIFINTMHDQHLINDQNSWSASILPLSSRSQKQSDA